MKNRQLIVLLTERGKTVKYRKIMACYESGFLITECELTVEHPSDNINQEVRKWDLKEAGLGD